MANIGQAYFPILTPEQATPGATSIGRTLSRALQLRNAQLNNQRSQATLPYAGPQAAANLQAKQLENQWFAPEKQAEIDYKNKLSAMHGILNQYLPQQQQASLLGTQLANQIKQAQAPYAGPQAAADVDLTKAQAQNQRMGGANAGVDAQRQRTLMNNVINDNPQLSAGQVSQAIDAYAAGKDSLPDGTKLNPPSQLTLTALGALAKSATTAPLITQQVTSQQAENESDYLSGRIQQYTAPYGDTLFNKSPKMLMDSFSSDPESQKRLGQYIAGRALQFEQAQIRQRLSGAKSSEGATKELMQMSGQLIDETYPKLSATARQEAMNAVDDSLKGAFNARKKSGINAAQTLNTGASNQSQNTYGDSANNDYGAAPSPAAAALMKLHGITQAEAESVLGGA